MPNYGFGTASVVSILTCKLSVFDAEFEGGVHHCGEGDEQAYAAGEEGEGLETEQHKDKYVDYRQQGTDCCCNLG